jgi:hypothetical protein
MCRSCNNAAQTVYGAREWDLVKFWSFVFKTCWKLQASVLLFQLMSKDAARKLEETSRQRETYRYVLHFSRGTNSFNWFLWKQKQCKHRQISDIRADYPTKLWDGHRKGSIQNDKSTAIYENKRINPPYGPDLFLTVFKLLRWNSTADKRIHHAQ